MEEMGVERLPEVTIDMNLPSRGSTAVLINGQQITGVQAIKVEIDSEKMVPMVTITLAAKHVQMEFPQAQVTMEKPVVHVPVFQKEK